MPILPTSAWQVLPVTELPLIDAALLFVHRGGSFSISPQARGWRKEGGERPVTECPGRRSRSLRRPDGPSRKGGGRIPASPRPSFIQARQAVACRGVEIPPAGLN